MRSRRTGFTLVEILMVVILLAIVASIVIPQMTDVTTISREANLRENLSKIRVHIQVYRNSHVTFPDADKLSDQLTMFTSFEGETSATKDANHPYGPYLEQMPANPITGDRAVRTTADTTAYFPPGDSDGGWWYNEANGRFFADLSDAHVDDQGQAYNRY